MAKEAAIIIYMNDDEFNLLLEAAKEISLKWSDTETAVSLPLLPRVVFKLREPKEEPKEEPNEQQ